MVGSKPEAFVQEAQIKLENNQRLILRDEKIDQQLLGSLVY